MAYKREGDTVTLTLTVDQYQGVVMALGIAAGTASKDGRPLQPWLQLADAVNEGNPDWRKYSEAAQPGSGQPEPAQGK